MVADRDDLGVELGERAHHHLATRADAQGELTRAVDGDPGHVGFTEAGSARVRRMAAVEWATCRPGEAGATPTRRTRPAGGVATCARARPWTSTSSQPLPWLICATGWRSVTVMRTVVGHWRFTATVRTQGRRRDRATAAAASTSSIGRPVWMPRRPGARRPRCGRWPRRGRGAPRAAATG